MRLKKFNNKKEIKENEKSLDKEIESIIEELEQIIDMESIQDIKSIKNGSFSKKVKKIIKFYFNNIKVYFLEKHSSSLDFFILLINYKFFQEIIFINLFFYFTYTFIHVRIY